METRIVFSQRLNETLASTKITPYQLSKNTQIPQATISRYCNNLREIGIVNLYKICNFLEVSADYLLGLSDY